MAYYRKPYGKTTDTSSAKPKSKWNGYTKPAPVVRGSAYKPILAPSSEQIAIFDFIKSCSGSLLIEALAGCGKTSTCVESMTMLPKDTSILYVIFANRNAREAESKCASHIEVKTCHALGLASIKRAYGSKVEVDAQGEKSDAIARALLGPEDEKAELRFNFVKAIGLAKGYLCENASDVLTVCDKHGIEFCSETEQSFADNVIKALDLSAQQYMRVDFDDMIWLPIRLNLSTIRYDIVYADECQDLSPARLELVLRCVKANTGRLVSVGDVNQSIFGFTGADERAMEKLKERTNAHILPLHTTYRCGKNIVAQAQSYVSDYVAHSSNCDGVVADVAVDVMMGDKADSAKGGDFILSRTNAPLLPLCLQFIKEGKKAAIAGKDLGRSLTWMIKRSNTQTVADFLSWVETWRNTECERLAAKNKSYDHINDKADCLCAVAEGVSSLTEMRARIEKLFSDTCDAHNKADCAECGDERIVLSTIHKAKGLERKRVFLLTDTLKDDTQEQRNVNYVAITRAITHLYYVKGSVRK